MAQAQLYATQYREIEIKTADQFELVLLLYKGAVHQLNLAKRYLDEKDIEQRTRAINKAVSMIGELQAALDFENGGEIAVSLGRLYTYMLIQLSDANSRQSQAPIDQVLGLLSTLQSTWEQARTEYNSGRSMTQARERSSQLAAR